VLLSLLVQWWKVVEPGYEITTGKRWYVVFVGHHLLTCNAFTVLINFRFLKLQHTCWSLYCAESAVKSQCFLLPSLIIGLVASWTKCHDFLLFVLLSLLLIMSTREWCNSWFHKRLYCCSCRCLDLTLTLTYDLRWLMFQEANRMYLFLVYQFVFWC